MAESTPTRSYAVVTGASSGIGLELAKLLVAEGFDVLAAAQDDRLQVAVEGLRAGAVTGQGATRSRWTSRRPRVWTSWSAPSSRAAGPWTRSCSTRASRTQGRS